MGNSIDSFWLLLILQHGVFALLLLLLACLYAVFHALNLVHRHCDQHRWMVSAWIMSFMSLILIGFTVDYFRQVTTNVFLHAGGNRLGRNTILSGTVRRKNWHLRKLPNTDTTNSAYAKLRLRFINQRVFMWLVWFRDSLLWLRTWYFRTLYGMNIAPGCTHFLQGTAGQNQPALHRNW